MGAGNVMQRAGLGVAFLAAALAFERIQVGKPFPPVVLGGKGTSQAAQDGPAAVLWRQAPLTDGECEALYKANERLAGDRVRLLVLSAGQHPCTAKGNLVVPAQPSQLTTLAQADTAPAGSWRLVIVDPYSIVRSIDTLPEGRGGIERAATIATTWEAGRQSFITQCGHCHGNDGADLSYNGIKTLAGISRRMPGERILEGGRQSGAVDMTTWPQSVKDALLLYIQGL